MEKHLIFFVHGMGTHDDTWHEKGVDVLRSVWNEYDQLSTDSFDDRIQTHAVIYNDVFETWRTRMAEDFNGFKAALQGADGGGLADEDTSNGDAVERKLDTIATWIGAADTPTFVWSHAMDVVLYRFFLTIRTAIDVSVIKQILQRLETRDYATWSICAHSLGTSVTHNAINSLYGAGVGDVAPLDPVQMHPRMIAMVANVSRVLERPGAKVYTSRVKPGTPSQGATCSSYLNIRHKLDPFTHPQPFDRDGWPDAVTASRRYRHIRPDHIGFSRDELMRVHDLDHYFQNPRVHVPFLRSVVGRFEITDDELEREVMEFDAQNAPAEQVRSRLEGLLPRANSPWSSIVDLIKRLG